jgi:hypothetical protein
MTAAREPCMNEFAVPDMGHDIMAYRLAKFRGWARLRSVIERGARLCDVTSTVPEQPLQPLQALDEDLFQARDHVMRE